jgi:uncharacterized protein YqcC (DUF446 family)
MPPINAPKSARLLEQIELELKRLYRLQPLAPDKFIDMGAFGTNTMTFEQWLQFVPAVKEALAGERAAPAKSQVGSHAVKCFDGDADACHLKDLICEFDATYEQEVGALHRTAAT